MVDVVVSLTDISRIRKERRRQWRGGVATTSGILISLSMACGVVSGNGKPVVENGDIYLLWFV